MNSLEYPHAPYISRNTSHWPTCLSPMVWVCLHSNLCSIGSKTRIFSATECILAVQGYPRSMPFGTNRKRVRYFLLVRHCDYGAILLRFWDTATDWLKIAYFATLSPLEFCGEVNREETRVMGLFCSEDRVIVTWVVLTWYQRVTVWQTIIQTDIVANTALWCAVITGAATAKLREQRTKTCADAESKQRFSQMSAVYEMERNVSANNRCVVANVL